MGQKKIPAYETLKSLYSKKFYFKKIYKPPSLKPQAMPYMGGPAPKNFKSAGFQGLTVPGLWDIIGS